MNIPDPGYLVQIGTIKRITDRGFGFISFAGGGGSDLFFHAKELINVEFNELREGDQVGFDIVEGLKGQSAINISLFNHETEDTEIEDTDTDTTDFEQRLHLFCCDLAFMVAKDATTLEHMEWRDLERLIAEVFAGIGFDVELTPCSKDGGKDVVITYRVNNEIKSFVIEIKHWRSGNRVGNGAIIEFLHVIARENRNGGLFLATGGYCNNALENLTEIYRYKIRLGEKEKIVSLCRKYVRSKKGIWSPPEQLDEVIFEDTV